MTGTHKFEGRIKKKKAHLVQHNAETTCTRAMRPGKLKDALMKKKEGRATREKASIAREEAGKRMKEERKRKKRRLATREQAQLRVAETSLSR